MVAPTERENSLTARNGGPTRPQDRFLSPFVHRRREMAHPVLTKGFLQLSPEAAMLPGPRLCDGPFTTMKSVQQPQKIEPFNLRQRSEVISTAPSGLKRCVSLANLHVCSCHDKNGPHQISSPPGTNFLINMDPPELILLLNLDPPRRN